jgi:hypothetical protein
MRIMGAADQSKMKSKSGIASARFFSPAIPLIIFFCIFSGCAKHKAVQLPSSPLPPNAQGVTSFKILTNAPGRQSTDSSTFREIIPPMPVGELKTPDYPERALKARFGNARIVVRVQLNDSGGVVGITESPMEESKRGRFFQEFWTEVEKAVRQWNFLPAKSQECRQGSDLNGDGKPDYTVVISTQPIPVYFDVQFEFSIVNGVGQSQSQ